jgi:hypothetical protein
VVIGHRFFEAEIWPDQIAAPGPRMGRPRQISWQPCPRRGPVLVYSRALIASTSTFWNSGGST